MKPIVFASFASPVLLASSAIAWQPSPAKPSTPAPSTANRPTVVAKPAAGALKAPQGFRVEEFASGFQKPRIMLEAPNGEILVSDSAEKGSVVVIADSNRDGKADGAGKTLIAGLDRPYGLVFWKDYLYVGEPTSLKRYKFDAKAMTAGKGEEVVSMAGYDKGHWTRSIVFDSKGEKLYLNVGSGSNADPDEDPRRATILECNPDGSGCHIFASGLRNATGIAFRPGTNELWAAVQERDGLGDDVAPDFFTHVRRGGFYGWPWAYFGPNEDPRNAGKRPDLVKKTIVPDVSLGPHVAVMDWKFYRGTQFPQRYRGGAFFAFRGSSNRTKRVGYSVAYLPFGSNGKPAGHVEDFVTGWMLSPDQKEVWGRPVGICQVKDGSLLVSDDGGNKIWRISYGR
jgi:glucose/arabinose dehydrogenase